MKVFCLAYAKPILISGDRWDDKEQEKLKGVATAKAIVQWQKKIADEDAFIKFAQKHRVPKASISEFEASDRAVARSRGDT